MSIFSSLLGTALSTTLVTPEQGESSGKITGKFKFLGFNDNLTDEYHFEYDDNWFKNSPYDIPFDMVRFSLCASMSASKSEDITDLMDQLGFFYVNKVNEEKEGLNVLAGSVITDSVYYPAHFVDGHPYFNSIAYAIGKKEIDDSTVIMVNIRGGDYGIEWGGDFYIGDGIDHEGFLIASDQVLEGLKYFIESQKITGKKKIWIVGYSRAAAVTNLTAARLNRGEIEGVTPEDIYAFCFECPRTTRAEDTQDSSYENIHCFINPDDLIPKAPMAMWGYKRYGKNHHYPAYESDVKFDESYRNMKKTMVEILGEDLNIAYDATYDLNTFADNLAFTAVSPKVYVEKFQTPLMEVMIGLFGGIKSKTGPSMETMVALKALEEGIIHLNPDNAMAFARLMNMKDGNLMSVNFDCPLLLDHTMQVSLCWMETLKSFSELGTNGYRIVALNGVTGVTVLDSSNEPLVTVRDRKVEKIKNGLWAEYTVSGELIIIMPVDSSYTLTISSALEDMIAYTVSNFDMGLGRKNKIYDYGILPFTDGKTYTAFIPELESSEEPILRQSEETLKPVKVYLEDEIEYFRVEVETSGKGNAYGGGYFTQGSFVGLTAKADEGAAFEGWFIDDKKVSDRPFYQIPVKESFKITAKFN